MAVVAGTTSAVTIADIETAAAVTAVFDPIPSNRLGGQSVYGRVVTDGAGTFHSVVREDVQNQQIVYRRSVDGGETWTVAGRFAGDSGRATRPWIAVDGDRMAIVFIGLWCEPAHPDICHEVPYLTTSDNAGARWLTPLPGSTRRRSACKWRSTTTASGSRGTAWAAGGCAAHERRRCVVVRVGRLTPPTTSRWTPPTRTMVLAFHTPPVAPSTTPSLGVVTAHSQFLNPMQTLPLPAFFGPVAATADGTAHVLFVDQRVDSNSPPPMVRVTSATGFGTFGAPIPVMPAGQVGDDRRHNRIGRGRRHRRQRHHVGVGQLRQGRRLLVADTRVVEGTGCQPDHPEPGRDHVFATPPQGRPLARFDWSVPPTGTSTATATHCPTPPTVPATTPSTSCGCTPTRS